MNLCFDTCRIHVIANLMFEGNVFITLPPHPPVYGIGAPIACLVLFSSNKFINFYCRVLKHGVKQTDVNPETTDEKSQKINGSQITKM